ncbi:hypothetical protein [Alsobacter soli]|uniref:hypothetical protein n=1 Tax=Alsobacter soli TaxID=2109933 RepID=UPI0011B21D10|nr:hypothetical protein [Alsobacter soli]
MIKTKKIAAMLIIYYADGTTSGALVRVKPLAGLKFMFPRELFETDSAYHQRKLSCFGRDLVDAAERGAEKDMQVLLSAIDIEMGGGSNYVIALDEIKEEVRVNRTAATLRQMRTIAENARNNAA